MAPRPGRDLEPPSAARLGWVVRTPDNITIQIDPSGWFSGGLDPRNAADKQAIEDNIRASIDAFEDDDREAAQDRGDRLH